MQNLKLSNDLFVRIFEAIHPKRLTIRNGRRDIVPGKLELIAAEPSGDKTLVCLVDVTRVTHCSLWEVTPEEMRSDGFIDKHRLLDGMRKYYPDITPSSVVTVINFRDPELHHVDNNIIDAVNKGVIKHPITSAATSLMADGERVTIHPTVDAAYESFGAGGCGGNVEAATEFATGGCGGGGYESQTIPGEIGCAGSAGRAHRRDAEAVRNGIVPGGGEGYAADRD